MIQEYENYLRAIKGYSENTIRAYCADLRSFAQWARENTELGRWRDVTREMVDNYLIFQQARGLSAATTNRHLAAISGLFRYFQRQGYEVNNPCKYESRRKTAQTIPGTIPPGQIIKAYKHAKGLSKTMLGILATTGIRIQELLDLQWEDIDFTSSTLKIRGKGSKERLVTTEHAVLTQLQQVKNTLRPQGRMFYVSQRKARYMIYEALKPYSNCTHLTPHAIRHTFATYLAKNGENVATIAKILGHAHIETSQKYINMAEITKAHQGISLTQNN